MMGGEQPYAALSDAEVQARVCDAGGERLPRPADCPEELWKLVAQCWEADPKLRPTPQQLLEQVRLAVGEEVGGSHHTHECQVHM